MKGYQVKEGMFFKNSKSNKTLEVKRITISNDGYNAVYCCELEGDNTRDYISIFSYETTKTYNYSLDDTKTLLYMKE